MIFNITRRAIIAFCIILFFIAVFSCENKNTDKTIRGEGWIPVSEKWEVYDEFYYNGVWYTGHKINRDGIIEIRYFKRIGLQTHIVDKDFIFDENLKKR
jgi:hypothetical protein